MSDTTAQGPLPALKSLRAKGWMATLALLAYLLGAGLYVAGERAQVYRGMQAMERVARHEKALALVEAAVAGAVLDAAEASSAEQPQPQSAAGMQLYMENCARLFATLEQHDKGYAALRQAIERSYGELQARPVRANWIDLREALHHAAEELEVHRRRLVDERDALSAGYRRHYDAVTVESLLLSVVGLVAFGTVAAWFFSRLARDIRRLEEHARRIVGGARGTALSVRREDELGRLMQAVNQMSADLDERERQLQLEAQKRSHQEKMLAVGALAAGVAHEVNNPLMVISSVAQELQTANAPLPPQEVAESARQILLQTHRAGQAASQLAEVAAPRKAEMDWLDLNALLRQAAQLQGYDRRYRRFVFDLHLDPTLPAVCTSASAVQQVLMQLLSLVCDAVAAVPQTPAQVRLITLPEYEGVTLQILFPPVLDFTRAEAQRSLLLCRAIVEPLRGRLAFGQAEGPLQRIKLTLPADTGSEEG